MKGHQTQTEGSQKKENKTASLNHKNSMSIPIHDYHPSSHRTFIQHTILSLYKKIDKLFSTPQQWKKFWGTK